MIYPMIFAILLIAAMGCAIAMARADMRRRIIPDVYLFPFMLIGLLLTTFWGWPLEPTDAAIGAAAGYTITAMVGGIYGRMRGNRDQFPPIGMGDVKLMGAGGLWLGVNGLAVAVIIACLAGIMWAWRRQTRYVPFAPFFMIGAFIALIGMWFLL